MGRGGDAIRSEGRESQMELLDVALVVQPAHLRQLPLASKDDFAPTAGVQSLSLRSLFCPLLLIDSGCSSRDGFHQIGRPSC